MLSILKERLLVRDYLQEKKICAVITRKTRMILRIGKIFYKKQRKRCYFFVEIMKKCHLSKKKESLEEKQSRV